MKSRYKNYRRSRSSSGETFLWIFILALIPIAKKLNIGFKSIRSMKMISSNLVYGIISVIVSIIVLRLLIIFIKKKRKQMRYINSGISIVDKMKGNEFESFLQAHFEKLGYKVKLTKASNDYGADLLLKKSGETIVVQAKRYNAKVGIKAVQEIVASLNYYKATKGIVITNNYFTKNAIDLARVNNIELWDRKGLINIMIKNGSKNLADQTISNTNEYKVCPECGGDLRLKKGKYGEFYGCSNYPKCRFTRNL